MKPAGVCHVEPKYSTPGGSWVLEEEDEDVWRVGVRSCLEWLSGLPRFLVTYVRSACVCAVYEVH